MKNTNFITRFAPSPTGGLHKGHAFSALTAYEAAIANNGKFLLRIEDIDTTRCKPEHVQDIFDDMEWLDLHWEMPVRHQSNHFDHYENALKTLQNMGVVYRCFCTRKMIQETNPKIGPEGIIYPGTCKHINVADLKQHLDTNKSFSWRLNIQEAQKIICKKLSWCDTAKGEIQAEPELLGDVILSRKDTPTSYNLSVTVDDALQNISHIIRGKDLWHSTHIHRILQALLNLPTPIYYHHDLLLDKHGEKFAKRNKSVTLKSIRESGVSAAQLKKELGFA